MRYFIYIFNIKTFAYHHISYRSFYVIIIDLHLSNDPDFISAAQQNLIRGPGSKTTVAGSSWSASRARGAFAYRNNRSVSFPIRRQCFACALTVTTKRGSRACVTRWLLALARIVLLPRPKRARVASRACSSSRCPSTMRGVSLIRPLRLKVYRERRPLGPPLFPSSLASPSRQSRDVHRQQGLLSLSFAKKNIYL